MKMAPKVTLTYFDLRARAELARLIMAAGEIEFEDKRVSSEWPELKPNTPFGSLPVLNYGDDEVAQSMTIARFLAKKAKLAGKDDLEQAQADMIVDYISDLTTDVIKVIMAKTPEEKNQLGETFFKTTLPNFLKTSEALLKKRGGKHFAGSDLTWGDIAMFNILDLVHNKKLFASVPGHDACEKFNTDYPLLTDLFKVVGEQPGINKWVQTRPDNKF